MKEPLFKQKFIYKSDSMTMFSSTIYDAYTPKLALHKILNAMIRKGNHFDQSMVIVKNKNSGREYKYFVIIEKLDQPIKKQIGSVVIFQKWKKIIIRGKTQNDLKN